MSISGENLFRLSPELDFQTEKNEYLTFFPLNYNEISTELQTLDDNQKNSFNLVFGFSYIDSSLKIDENKEHSKKEFKCEELNCDKKYKTKENLKLHILNIHLGVKPYVCNFCSRRFSHRNGKTYHERKFHMNYLPYSCSEGCNKHFANKSSLNYHLKFHHKLIKFYL